MNAAGLLLKMRKDRIEFDRRTFSLDNRDLYRRADLRI